MEFGKKRLIKKKLKETKTIFKGNSSEKEKNKNKQKRNHLEIDSLKYSKDLIRYGRIQNVACSRRAFKAKILNSEFKLHQFEYLFTSLGFFLHICTILT